MASSKKLVSPNTETWKQKTREVLGDLLLLVLSSLLFAFAFPSFLSTWGWFPLAFISVFPVFIIVHRSSWLKVCLYGIFYGYLAYGLFNYWASTFHPLAIIILPTVYAVYFLMVFPILKLADIIMPKYGYLLQILIWISYEYLRTTGFLGYPYGILGYSQYLFLPLIRVSAVTGVWGVSYLVVFPSVYLGNALKDGTAGFRSFVRSHRITPVIWLGLFIISLIYGLVVDTDYSDRRQFRIAMVQHSSDTWDDGDIGYERNFETMSRLSLESLKEDPEIVIWSETAFVPGIDWHTRYRTNERRYRLVKQFKDFMATQEIPYLTGNSDKQIERDEDGEMGEVDYNSVLLYEDGELKQIYRKIHLVPFTESFPFKKQFPKFYQLLVNNDYHFWKQGTEYTVFETQGVHFSTPICFEDVFGDLNRKFVLAGAELFINMTNDSWSGAVPAEMQHMAMSVFRAIENRRSMVRGTNSGITCTIEPSGKITAILEPFIEGYLVSEVPVIDDVETLYTRYGDWLAKGTVYLCLAVMLFGLTRCFLKRSR